MSPDAAPPPAAEDRGRAVGIGGGTDTPKGTRPVNALTLVNGRVVELVEGWVLRCGRVAHIARPAHGVSYCGTRLDRRVWVALIGDPDALPVCASCAVLSGLAPRPVRSLGARARRALVHEAEARRAGGDQ